MSRTRPSRAAARTLPLLLLASLVMLGPLAANPSHAWTPPPAPLPIEPGDTDGMDDDLLNDRPRPGTHGLVGARVSGAPDRLTPVQPAPPQESASPSKGTIRSDLRQFVTSFAWIKALFNLIRLRW